MVAVVVGVGRDDHLVEPQVRYPFLDAEGHHEIVELLVLVDGRPRAGEDVQRHALQPEDRLGQRVPRRDHRTGGRRSLGDEDRGILPELRVIEVVLAVLEIRDLDGDAPGRLAGFLLDGVQFLPQTLVLRDLLLDLLSGLLVLVQEVHHGAADLRDEPAPDIGIAQLVLGLGFENWFLQLDGDCARNRLPHVHPAVILLEVFVDALEDALAEGALVGPAVGGVLAVHEGEERLAVIGGVREGKLDVLALVVRGLVEDVLPHLGLQEVQQAVFGNEALLVEDQTQAAVQAGVVPHAAFDVVGLEGVFPEDLLIGQELDIGAVRLVRGALVLPEQLPPLVHRLRVTPVPVGHDAEITGKGVDRLGAHAVQSHAELKDLVVVLGARVDDRSALHDLAEGNPAAEVADADPVVFDGHVDLPAVAHDELVHGVVDHFLEEDVDAVFGIAAVPEPADIHARPEPYVFQRRERLDLAFVVDGGVRGVRGSRGGRRSVAFDGPCGRRSAAFIRSRAVFRFDRPAVRRGAAAARTAPVPGPAVRPFFTRREQVELGILVLSVFRTVPGRHWSCPCIS